MVFVVSLVALLLLGSIATYRNELYITNRQIEQIQIETLFQMGRAAYIEEQQQVEEVLRQATYDFPYGRVDVSLSNLTETYRKLYFRITIHQREGFFPIIHLLKPENLNQQI